MRDFTNDHSALALNTATLGHILEGHGAGWEPKRVIDACAERGFGGITYWMREIGSDAVEIGEQTRSAGMRVTGLCRPPFLVGPYAASSRKEVIDGFLESIDMASALGADALTIVVGGVIPGSHSMAESLKVVAEFVAEVIPRAEESDVNLALEPLHPVYGGDRSCLVTVKDALDMCDGLDHPKVGIAIDVYHVWWDLSLRDALRRTKPGRILGYHLCDWLAQTRDVLLDRGMMGDGVADLKQIRSVVEEAGYMGPCEVEIFSVDDWWKRNPCEVLDTIVKRFRSVC